MEDPTPALGSLSPSSSDATPVSRVSARAATIPKSPTTSLRKNVRQSSEELETLLLEEMEEEKKRYPGASSWAPDEERLFEILYKRQDLPMLPKTWNMDLSGVPIADTAFQTSDKYPPIIYAHLDSFRATQSLMRLIDLTSGVRSHVQTGHTRKVPGLIKRQLDKFLGWTAQDGDYAQLRIVPNVLTEVIDTTMKEKEITEYIQRRMRALARLQREFLRVDEKPEFWDVVKPSILTSPMVKIEPEDESPGLERWPKAAKRKYDMESDINELSNETPTRKRPKRDPGFGRFRSFSRSGGVKKAELIQSSVRERSGTPEKPINTKEIKIEKETSGGSSGLPSPPHLPDTSVLSHPTYRRHPPVVYGLFILNSSVLILTADSSKGHEGYVSFHVQVNFQDHRQSVWNALTVAIVACRARDELMTRKSDFEKLPIVEDSDPDA